MPKHSFHTNERLKSRKTIGRIFENSQSFIAYPIRIAWVLDQDNIHPDFPIQFTSSVPKRRYPIAVQRHRIRRRIWETFRLHKHLIYQDLPKDNTHQYAMMAIYVGKEELPYGEIEAATKKWIKRFLKTVKSQNSTNL